MSKRSLLVSMVASAARETSQNDLRELSVKVLNKGVAIFGGTYLDLKPKLPIMKLFETTLYSAASMLEWCQNGRSYLIRHLNYAAKAISSPHDTQSLPEIIKSKKFHYYESGMENSPSLPSIPFSVCRCRCRYCVSHHRS